ncbi:hypothetical protein [Azospirillum rugosum]|uniref:Lipoprotein n=1 Tax=Azospirillum rugosum TaxID=416170 RepID=A0ABS4SFA5_9PROT|nr:hypothetical protein [Azospirillum rugosum]MBP2291095.1 hypothetical protein [Azospirillum rugosum]MDQ0524841.1 hypothetical protein [Azospirillum rugosum]
MRRSYSGRTAVRVAALLLPLALLAPVLLSGCQATNSPPLPRAAVPAAFVRPSDSGLSDAPGRVVAQNKGWVVRAHPATQSGSAYCMATRADSASPLSFRATAKGAAMLVNGDQKAQPSGGESRLMAIFPDGASMALEAKPLPNGGVIVPVELPKYEDLFEPFMRSKAVTLKSAEAEKIGDVSLGGSSWALNALDECRILHTDGQFAEAAPRPAQP